jgi:hypothetical protein
LLAKIPKIAKLAKFAKFTDPLVECGKMQPRGSAGALIGKRFLSTVSRFMLPGDPDEPVEAVASSKAKSVLRLLALKTA